jgi:hypothetical protein
MVAVGYGREAEDGSQTLGGRDANELADNMLSLKQDLNSATAEIKSTSLVGCNLESDNPTDNQDSQYGKQVLQKLHQGGFKGKLSVRSRYVAIQSDGTAIFCFSAVTHGHHFDFACDVFKLSAINHSVSAVFVHLYDGGFCWVLKGKFKGAVFDIVIGFSLTMVIYKLW